LAVGVETQGLSLALWDASERLSDLRGCGYVGPGPCELNFFQSTQNTFWNRALGAYPKLSLKQVTGIVFLTKG